MSWLQILFPIEAMMAVLGAAIYLAVRMKRTNDGLFEEKGELLRQLELNRLKRRELDHALAELRVQISDSHADAANTDSAEDAVALDDDDTDYRRRYGHLKNAIARSLSGGRVLLQKAQSELEGDADIALLMDFLDKLKQRHDNLGELAGDGEARAVDIDTQVVTALPTDVELEQRLSQLQGAIDAIEREKVEQDRAQCPEVAGKSATDNPDASQFYENLLKHANQRADELRHELVEARVQLMDVIRREKRHRGSLEELVLLQAKEKQLSEDFTELEAECNTARRAQHLAEARVRLLEGQISVQHPQPGIAADISKLEEKLQSKTGEMDRLVLERDMLEQEFLQLNDKTQPFAEIQAELQRLKREHAMLEEKYNELVEEDSEHTQSDNVNPVLGEAAGSDDSNH